MILHTQQVFVTLADPDGQTLTHFYTQLFNQPPAQIIPQVYAEFHLPGLKLGIFKPKQTHQVEFSNSHHSGMSLCIPVDSLETAIAHLTTLGHPPPGEIIQAPHGREIYAYDPLGNRLIFFQPN